MSFECNAVIEKATITNDDHGMLTVWLMLDYGGSGQGFGGYSLHLPKTSRHYSMEGPAGHFIWRVMEVAGVSEWGQLNGRCVRVRRTCKGFGGDIEAIGHIVKNDWFSPKDDFSKYREKEAARDAAVRAAEDGRTGPLPTLEEAIDAMIPKSVSASSPVDHKNKGDGMETDGLRTERVVLEITHGCLGPVDWSKLITASPTRQGESVRVVEECCLDRINMGEIMRQRDAAIRERNEFRGSWILSEESGMRLLAERNAALDAADGLRKRVAELEAASGGNGQGSLDGSPQAASGGNYSATPNGSQSKSGVGVLAAIAEAFGCKPDDHTDLVEAARLLVRERDEAVAKAASGGGEAEPVAWARLRATANPNDFFWCHIEETYGDPDDPKFDLKDGETVVPLYRAPPQPRGWLTEEEIEAVADAADTLLLGFGSERLARILRELLARSTPPEVVLPMCIYERGGDFWRGWMSCESDFLEAIAAAGVAVKEVGRE